MTKDLFFENSFQYVTEKDQQILVGTSFAFVLAPGIYGIFTGCPVVGVLSIVAGIISMVHWGSSPMCEKKHVIDLFAARTLATVYIRWIVYYCINLPKIYSWICVGIACCIIIFYAGSVYFGNKEDGSIWILFHYAFHYCCFLTQIYLYAIRGLAPPGRPPASLCS